MEWENGRINTGAASRYCRPIGIARVKGLRCRLIDDTPAAGTNIEPVLSVVVPLLNEEEVLATTHRRLTEELSAIGLPYEIIYVDDGSTDRSPILLGEFAAADQAVCVVHLSRNFGHEMATTAGLHQARGRAAIVIDADLQDPPELMHAFVAKWREGYQVVYGVRRSRDGESWLKKGTSFLFYRLMRAIADVKIPRDTGDFRLLDRSVLDVYRQLREDPRFFRGLISWVGFRQTGVLFDRQPRAAGRSKYRYNRLVRLAFDTITAFSTFPALFFTLLAFGCLLATGLGTAALIALATTETVIVPVWGWVAIGFLWLWNVQFIAMAVFGEYLVRTHRHVQQRPLYVVARVVGKREGP